MFDHKNFYSSSCEDEEEDINMFDCKDIYNNNCSDDDMWKKYDNYLLTPPQSPPIIPTFGNYEQYTSEFEMAINSLPSSPIIDEELEEDAAALAAIDDVLLNGGCSESLLNEIIEQDSNCVINENDIITADENLLNGLKFASADLLHDCMWSGQCNENCNSKSRLLCTANNNAMFAMKRESSISSTCNALGTSPTMSLINFALSDICANSCSTEGHLDGNEDEDVIEAIHENIEADQDDYDENEQDDENDEKGNRKKRRKKVSRNTLSHDYDEDEDEKRIDLFEGYGRQKKYLNSYDHNTLKQQNLGATLLASTNESLKNDHSYGSPASSPRSMKKCKSLIYSTKGYVKSKGLKVTAIKTESSSSHAQQQAMTIKFVNRQNITSNAVNINSKNNSNNNISSSNGEYRRCKLSQSKRSTSSTSPCGSPSSSRSSFSSSCSNSSSSNGIINLGTCKGNSKQKNGDFGPSILAKSSSSNSNNNLSQIVLSSSSLLSPLSTNSQSSTCSTASSSARASSSSTTASTKTAKSMYPERRREHNDSERKRRDHLRNAFHYLRDQIPKLKDAQKKPARIVILGEATSFVKSLQEKQRYLDKMKDTEMRKREKLLKRLNALKERKFV